MPFRSQGVLVAKARSSCQKGGSCSNKVWRILEETGVDVFCDVALKLRSESPGRGFTLEDNGPRLFSMILILALGGDRTIWFLFFELRETLCHPPVNITETFLDHQVPAEGTVCVVLLKDKWKHINREPCGRPQARNKNQFQNMFCFKR